MNHAIRITMARAELRDWTDYEISLDLAQPANTFSLSGPFTRERYEAVAPGTEVTIEIDGRPVIAGYITARRTGSGSLAIDGHDRAWRMVRDAAPMRRLHADTIQSLAEALTAGLFAQVLFQNAANRALYGGGNRKIGREPPVFNSQRDPRKIPLGATKWTALAEILRRAELLAWSSADGQALVIARPNFSQEPRHELRIELGTTTEPRSSCEEIAVAETIEGRYQSVACLGSARVARGDTGYGVNAQRRGVATDATMPVPIAAQLVEDVRSATDATALAQAAIDEAKSRAFVATVTAWGHGQAGRLYAPDTTADIIDERIGLRQRMYCTAVTYSGARRTESAQLTYVPLNTRLVIG